MCGLSFILHGTFGTFECDNSPLKFHIPSMWNTRFAPQLSQNIKYKVQLDTLKFELSVYRSKAGSLSEQF